MDQEKQKDQEDKECLQSTPLKKKCGFASPFFCTPCCPSLVAPKACCCYCCCCCCCNCCGCCCLCILQPCALLKEAPEAPCWNYAQQTSTGQNPRAKRLVSVFFPHSLAKQRARSGVRLQLLEVSALGSLLLLSRCVCTKVHPLVLMLLLLLGPHFFSKGVVRESQEKAK